MNEAVSVGLGEIVLVQAEDETLLQPLRSQEAPQFCPEGRCGSSFTSLCRGTDGLQKREVNDENHLEEMLVL
jgi:hypothetical protein